MIVELKNIEDLNELYNLYKEDYKPHINEFTKVYGYLVNGNYVGFLVIDVIYDRCEIIDIFVINEFRNNKIATNMINMIEQKFKIDNITLEVNINNVNAISLYKKLGFKKVSIRKGYYNGCDALLMLKEIR